MKDNNFPKQFGLRLKQTRLKLGMRQIDFAKKFKLSQKKVSRWETGKSLPSVEKLIMLCKIMHMPVGFFFD